ncbi:hypothetical protein AALP_AA8G150900 [Arabis alpina]|uniref:Ubiquitin-like domain-containing protein n=1 Tax=Arabis alpina TaxID=50452 RepID=A0A087G768_ARAAL|nr:hypothetical protein AALP_AA8G150900 [Arabis alpina]
MHSSEPIVYPHIYNAALFAEVRTIVFRPQAFREIWTEYFVETDFKEQKADLKVRDLSGSVPVDEAKVGKLCYLLDEEAHTQSESGRNGPLNRTMGWDGKPIPYWLCKLGLGQAYKCEICGNKSYGGKRAFERHFRDWRHEFGLRDLGIPSTQEFNGITSIEEAKKLWLERMPQEGNEMRERMPKRQRLVEADGNLGSVLARSQLTDQETEKKSSNQVPACVAIPPPVIRSYGDSQPFPPAGVMVPPPEPLESHKFTCSLPDGGIKRKELDVIMLTAQFWARYGKCFWDNVDEKVDKYPEFGFMKTVGESLTLLRGLVRAYLEVFCTSKEELRRNAADVETVLENCYHRVQWGGFRLEQHWKKTRGKKGPVRLKIDEAYGQLLTTRPRIDESELVPEDQFLAQQPPGCATIWIYVPQVRDPYVEITVQSLSETVASLKEKIKREVHLPVSEQKISGKTGVLEDNKSLAYYNVGAGELLTMSV